MVVCRTPDGEVAFLTGHAPFLGVLEAGTVKVKPVAGADVTVTVGGGFVEVKDDKVSILSDAADIEGAPSA
jgi:F-type H+-transporting ATPase subunit epsilon